MSDHDNGKVSLKELKQAIIQEKKLRAEACSEEIRQALERYNCQMGASAGITPDGRIQTQIQLVALDHEEG